jgi:hypothetical protein
MMSLAGTIRKSPLRVFRRLNGQNLLLWHICGKARGKEGRNGPSLALQLKFASPRDIMMISEEVPMPDLLVRDIDPEVYKRMKKAAVDQGKSLAQTAREALANTFKISRDEVWAEIDRFRERIGRTKDSSLEDIREMRDRDVSGG